MPNQYKKYTDSKNSYTNNNYKYSLPKTNSGSKSSNYLTPQWNIKFKKADFTKIKK